MKSWQGEVDHLFLSPHFDDGVFSCGGTIRQLVSSGCAVTVMTLMGGAYDGPGLRSPILDDLHRRWQAGPDPLRTRQAEDKLALRNLKARSLHLPLTDCVYRAVEGAPLYPTEESLWGVVHRADFAPRFLDALPLPPRDADLTLWLPLAVGQHVDHLVTRDWGLRLQAERPPRWTLRWYAEYPYNTKDGATEKALSAMDLPLVRRAVELSEADMNAKLAAMARYHSQISTFWGSLAQMAAQTRRVAIDTVSGRTVERYWQVA